MERPPHQLRPELPLPLALVGLGPERAGIVLSICVGTHNYQSSLHDNWGIATEPVLEVGGVDASNAIACTRRPQGSSQGGAPPSPPEQQSRQS